MKDTLKIVVIVLVTMAVVALAFVLYVRNVGETGTGTPAVINGGMEPIQPNK